MNMQEAFEQAKRIVNDKRVDMFYSEERNEIQISSLGYLYNAGTVDAVKAQLEKLGFNTAGMSCWTLREKSEPVDWDAIARRRQAEWAALSPEEQAESIRKGDETMRGYN